MKQYRKKLPPWGTAACLLICCFAIFLSDLMIQPGSVTAQLAHFFQHPVLLALNLFPVAAVLLLLYFCIGNVFYSASVTSLLCNLLSYANLLKIDGRDDPLTPTDVALWREALNATGEYRLNMHWAFVAVIVVMAIVFWVLGVCFKSSRPRGVIRALAGVGVCGLFVLSMLYVYPDDELYSSTPVDSESNVTVVFNTRGFNYCFLHNFNLYPVEKPDGYSARQVEQWIEEDRLPAQTQTVQPNVIMVMCEAFSDLSTEDVFAYTPEDDPLRDFRAVADSDRAISGHIVVSNISAGTANTEFDVLTGMQTNMISNTATSAFRVIRRNTPSLPRTFAGCGYNTFFLHPGYDWFYNRANVYRFLGIADQVFSDAFDENDYKGTMISDAAFLEELKACFETRTANTDAPLFAYGVTIQNHQSYFYGKFGDTPEDVPLNTTVSAASMESLAVYMEGVRDSSAMLLALSEYLDTVEEPTVLVFFGDHRPALGTNLSAYQELGLSMGDSDDPQISIHTYETPYVLWMNKAYAETIDVPARIAALELPENNCISNIYLGSVVYELLGMTGQDSYFDYLTTARRTLPVICKESFMLPDGTYTRTLTDAQRAVMEKLDWWEYYRLKTQQVD